MACKNCEDYICCGECDPKQFVPIPVNEQQEEPSSKDTETSN